MVAKVYLNNVQVGSIPLEHYEKIKKFAYKDKKNYILQIFNIVKFLASLTIKAIQVLPFFWLLILFYCILFDQHALTQFISFLKENSPERIAVFIKDIVSVGLIFGVIYVLLETVLLMNSFGYENAFQSSIERSVLQLLEIPERGNVFIQVEKSLNG